MSDDIKKKFGIQRNRSYLNRDFGDFRNELVKYAGTYFKDKIQDFSEASMGGLRWRQHVFLSRSPIQRIKPKHSGRIR